MDHNKVIERIRSGAEDDLTVIYKKYRKEFLYWISRTYNISIEEGKDIYQASIITFYEKIITGKLVNLTSSAKTYLYAVAKNKIQEEKRNVERQEQALTEIKNSTSEEGSQNSFEKQEETFAMVEKCLEELGDPCKSILQLYYYNNLSITQITEKMNYKNSDTAKNIKSKCLKRLRKIYISLVHHSK